MNPVSRRILELGMLRDRLEPLFMLLLWHARSVLTFLLALAIVVGSIIGVKRMVEHFSSQSRTADSTEIDSEIMPQHPETPFERFLARASIDEIRLGISNMRLNPTSRSQLEVDRLYNLNCQLDAAHRILELDPDAEQQRFAIVAILRALSELTQFNMQQQQVNEKRMQELRANSKRYIDHADLRIRQAARTGQLVLGIWEMCVNPEPEAAAFEATRTKFLELARAHSDSVLVANRLFQLLDVIKQRGERDQWIAFMETYADVFAESREPAIQKLVSDVRLALKLERFSARS